VAPSTSNGRVVVYAADVNCAACPGEIVPARGMQPVWGTKRRRIGLPRAPTASSDPAPQKDVNPPTLQSKSQEASTKLARRTDRSSIIRQGLRGPVWKRRPFSGVNCLRAPPAGRATPVLPRGPGLGPAPPSRPVRGHARFDFDYPGGIDGGLRYGERPSRRSQGESS